MPFSMRFRPCTLLLYLLLCVAPGAHNRLRYSSRVMLVRVALVMMPGAALIKPFCGFALIRKTGEFPLFRFPESRRAPAALVGYLLGAAVVVALHLDMSRFGDERTPDDSSVMRRVPPDLETVFVERRRGRICMYLACFRV